MQIIGKDIPECLFVILNSQDLSGIILELKAHKIIPSRYSDEALNSLVNNDDSIEIIKNCLNGCLIDIDLFADGFDNAPEIIINLLCSSFAETKSFSASRNTDFDICNEINAKINENNRCLIETIDGVDSFGSISSNFVKLFNMAQGNFMVRLPIYYTKCEVPYVKGDISSCQDNKIIDDLISHLDLTDQELSSIYFDGSNQDILLDLPEKYLGAFSIHIEFPKDMRHDDAKKLINKINAYCSRKYARSEKEDIIECTISDAVSTINY